MNHIIELHKTNAIIWKFKYLNLFLVRDTQEVLDWLMRLNHTTTWDLFEQIWQPRITFTNARARIFDALQYLLLIHYDETNRTITATDKARAFTEWREPLPPLPNTAHDEPPAEQDP